MTAKLHSVQPVLMVRDVERSLAFYARLGFALVFRDHTQAALYAGVRRDQVELHLQWHDASLWEGPARDLPTYRFVVREVDALYEELARAGVLGDATAVTDTPWGTREFHLRDPDGNGLQFYRDL